MSGQTPIKIGMGALRVVERPPFDPSSVKYPTDYDITGPYGGHYHFMLSYGLKMHNDEDLEESKQILEQLKRQEYEDRVARAREEYERGGGIDQ